MAIRYGASAPGLVGHMPSGPGVISDERIAAIVKNIPPPVASFLLTSETLSSRIIFHHQKTQTNTLQLVDAVPVSTYKELRDALPSVKLVQVIHVLDEQSVEEARQVAAFVDAILLDSGNPNLSLKVLGGTGKVHNWKLSKKIRDSVPVPVFLAGGLTPENVRQAIDEVAPFGLDLCTGVRTDGKLDERKLGRFMHNAHI